jgi:predicted metal-dependent hydrolase
MTLMPDDAAFRKGLDLFNRGRFFDAHEVLEDVWRAAPRDRSAGHPLRLHLQGLVQLAVAFHHQSKGNWVGARSVLARALRNLEGAESSFPHLDLERLWAELEVWRRYLNDADAGAGIAARGKNTRPHTRPTLPQIMQRR